MASTHPPRGGSISGRKHLAFAAFTVMASSLLVLAGAEVYIRLTQEYFTPLTFRTDDVQYEPRVLARHVMKPDQETTIHNFVINHQGYRGPDFVLEKPEGAVRIMFLGGSMVFTITAVEGEDWPSLTGRALEARGVEKVEILNAGVPGHTTSDALGRFYGDLWRYHPDFVVICFAWNDLKLVQHLAEGKPLIDALSVYSPRPDPRRNYFNGLDRLLGETSQVYVHARHAWLTRRIKSGREGALPEKALAPLPPFDPSWLDQYRMNLSLLADAIRYAGGEPVFVTQPTLATAQASEEVRAEIEYDYVRMTHEDLTRAFGACRQAVIDVGREKQAAVIDVFDDMSGRPEWFTDHVHTSREGSRVIADYVAEGLLPLIEAGDQTNPSVAP